MTEECVFCEWKKFNYCNLKLEQQLYMKIKITYLVLIVVVTLGVFSSCKKDEAYNWRNIEPGKQQISGPDSIKGNDSTVYEYLAISRGGSTYTWEVLSGPITIKVDTLNKDPLHYHPFRAEIKANSSTNTTGSIIVRETTWAGKQGESDTFNIQKIFCFSSFNLDNFVGAYTCNEKVTNYLNNSFVSTSFDVNVTQVGGDTVMIDNFYGIGWQLNYVLSKDKNETLTIVKALFDYNDATFSGGLDVKGSGNYSTCSGTITVKFAMMDHALGDTVYSGIDYFKRK